MSELPDDELMLRYRDGNLAAFQELYRRHSRGLYRFIAWRSARREWVDEVAQDSWLALHHARSRYQPQGSFRTWLYQIARNRLSDLQRQQQDVLLGDMAQEADFIADMLAEAAPPAALADAALDQRQQTGALYAAIRQLPAEQKDALVLQHFSGLSIEEIAQLCEVPGETVKSRLRYAMRKLREHFAHEAKPQEEKA
ncbi:sigma-70 family RNA polymerase sigma factor [Massilia sp. BJB1822]|uniref:sigma-70 family RNA polymerase sigma factor n=1 Tax=Massilia sp. BJB1822 TaxID=2744470 RepID=UPI001E41965A|nr:sigma-70 family RNA polymerase sigma factor [Massilia sp. BJB1822]